MEDLGAFKTVEQANAVIDNIQLKLVILQISIAPHRFYNNLNAHLQTLK